MMKYRKKPVVIEAHQLTDEHFHAVYEWVEQSDRGVHSWCWDETYIENPERYIEIKTLEGVMRANEGDYIIKGVQGEMYPCKPDIFEMTYEAVEDE